MTEFRQQAVESAKFDNVFAPLSTQSGRIGSVGRRQVIENLMELGDDKLFDAFKEGMSAHTFSPREAYQQLDEVYPNRVVDGEVDRFGKRLLELDDELVGVPIGVPIRFRFNS